MENVVDDVFDDLLEQDEVFDEEMEIVETVFCDLDGGSVVPDDWKSQIYMNMIMFIYVSYLIVSEWQGGSSSSLYNVNQGSRQQQKTL